MFKKIIFLGTIMLLLGPTVSSTTNKSLKYSNRSNEYVPIELNDVSEYGAISGNPTKNISCKEYFCGTNNFLTLSVNDSNVSASTNQFIPNGKTINLLPLQNIKKSKSKTDNRVVVEQVNDFEMSTIVNVQTIEKYGTDEYNFSGTIVGKNCVLTSLSKLLNDKNEIYSNPYVNIGTSGSTVIEHVKVSSVIFPTSYFSSQSEFNWALLYLDQNIGLTYEYLGLQNYADISDKDVIHAGYCDEETKLYASAAHGCYSSTDYNYIGYSFFSETMTGGPLVYRDNGKDIVCGVISKKHEFKNIFGVNGYGTEYIKIRYSIINLINNNYTYDN